MSFDDPYNKILCDTGFITQNLVLNEINESNMSRNKMNSRSTNLTERKPSRNAKSSAYKSEINITDYNIYSSVDNLNKLNGIPKLS